MISRYHCTFIIRLVRLPIVRFKFNWQQVQPICHIIIMSAALLLAMHKNVDCKRWGCAVTRNCAEWLVACRPPIRYTLPSKCETNNSNIIPYLYETLNNYCNTYNNYETSLMISTSQIPSTEPSVSLVTISDTYFGIK